MEFQVTTDLSKLQPQVIEANFAETKAWLKNALAPYQAMVVSEDAIKSAKEDRATINKLKKSLDDKRKAIKKQWVQPYLEWEGKVNELIQMCDDASANIDNQVKAFENATKDSKKVELEQYFKEQSTGAAVDFYITFEQIFNPKWLNSTVSLDTAKAQIDEIVQETVDDLKVIADLESDFAEELFLVYKETHDIKKVIAKNKALGEIKAVSSAQKTLSDDWKAAENIRLPWETEAPQEKNKEEEKPKEKMYDLLLQLKLSEKQARSLKKFMATEGIEVVQSKMKENKS